MICINGRFLTEEPTGVQRYAGQLVRALNELRDDVVVLAPPGVRRSAVEGVEVRTIGSPNLLRWEQWDLPVWLLRHGTPPLVNLANRAPMLYRNQVSTLHDLIPILLKSEFSLRFRLLFRLVAWLGVARASRTVLTVSEFSRREIRSHYRLPASRVLVVPNAADEGWLGRRPAGGRDRTCDEPFVLTFGRSGTNRNVQRCIEAMVGVDGDRAPRLVLVGDPDPLLVDAARVLGDRAHFTGRISDAELADLYHRCLCFVAPSIYEGFDLPALEAQCAGTAVVASDIPVHREVLMGGALYFPPGDPDALAGHIRRLHASSEAREAVVASGRENSARYSWESSARRLDELIGALLR